MVDVIKKLKGFRTLLVNATAALGVIVAALNGIEFDQGGTVLIVSAVTAANAILRFFTNTPVFKGDTTNAS